MTVDHLAQGSDAGTPQAASATEHAGLRCGEHDLVLWVIAAASRLLTVIAIRQSQRHSPVHIHLKEPDPVFTTLLPASDVVALEICQDVLYELASLLLCDNAHVAHECVHVCTERRSALAD